MRRRRRWGSVLAVLMLAGVGVGVASAGLGVQQIERTTIGQAVFERVVDLVERLHVLAQCLGTTLQRPGARIDPRFNVLVDV